MGVSEVVQSRPTPNSISVAISPTNPTLQSGASLQFTAKVTGSDQSAVRWSVTAGTISANGMLQAPKVTSASSITVTATSEADNQRQASAIVEVTAPSPTLRVTTTALPTATVGEAYSATISATGGQPPYQWSDLSGALPSGIGLNGTSGLLSGMAKAAGTFSFVAKVTDARGNHAQQSLKLAVVTGSATSPCVAPNYGCARTDTAVIPLGTLPDWGGLQGAGTIFTDPSFNSRYPPKYVRVTDYQSGPNHWFSVGNGNGDDSHFNIDDTMLWLTNDGSAIFVFGLVPATMQVGLVSQLPTQTYCCSGQWSQINRNYFYTMTSDGKLWRLDFTGLSIASPGSPTASLVYDFAANCGASNMPVEAFAGVGAGDTIFSATFGTQDTTAHQVAAYNSATAKCYLYDTLAGTVMQYPGAASLGSITPSPDSSYIIHGAHGYGDGTWMLVAKSNLSCADCAVYHSWRIGTTTVNSCLTRCSGHWTETASGWFNDDQGEFTHSPSMVFRTPADFSTSAIVELNTGNAAIDELMETHPTAKNDPLGTHRYPIFASTTAPSMSKAYSNEIIGWSQTPGAVLRFGHTFSSGQSTNFQAHIAVGAVSSTGQFYAFTADGEGTLGNTDGVHSTCTLSEGTCRSDVFILNLTPP